MGKTRSIGTKKRTQIGRLTGYTLLRKIKVLPKGDKLKGWETKMEKRFGYVRVSSAEQNEARQLEALTAHGIAAEDITTDKLSGKNMDRPGLAALLEKVRAGDIVTVTSIDRLGRNTKDVLSIVEQLDSKGANLVCLQQKLDTSTPIGKCVLTILASFAEMERANIRQRQAEGIAIAKREGRFKGRGKKKLNELETIYTKWRQNDITASQGAKLLDISRSTFYRRMKQHEDEWYIDLE